MTVSRTLTIAWGGAETISHAESISSGGEIIVDEAVNDSQTDQQITFTLDISTLQLFYMVSDVAMTVETNSGSTPTDTFTLVANVPVAWSTNSGLSNPFSGDVTTDIFATNSSGTNGTLRIRALYDSTP